MALQVSGDRGQPLSTFPYHAQLRIPVSADEEPFVVPMLAAA